MSARIAAARSYSAAKTSGVWPHSDSRAFGSAPFDSSAVTTSALPAAAAKCSAVAPLVVVAFDVAARGEQRAHDRRVARARRDVQRRVGADARSRARRSPSRAAARPPSPSRRARPPSAARSCRRPAARSRRRAARSALAPPRRRRASRRRRRATSAQRDRDCRGERRATARIRTDEPAASQRRNEPTPCLMADPRFARDDSR